MVLDVVFRFIAHQITRKIRKEFNIDVIITYLMSHIKFIH